MHKYTLHRVFHKVPFIRSYLPETTICNPSTLHAYLNKYKTVFIKPFWGFQGRGVVKAWKDQNRYYYVFERGNPVLCASPADMYRKLRLAKKRPHMVQMGLQLAQINRRPFDIRLMMMRDTMKKWQYVGMMAKVAGNKSIITNIARGGGYGVTIDTALNQSLGLKGMQAAKKKGEIIRLGHRCNQIYSRYWYDWQVGYDIGIDQKGKVWLIESNPGNPSHPMFLRMNDKSIFRKIKQMAAAYRRVYVKKP